MPDGILDIKKGDTIKVVRTWEGEVTHVSRTVFTLSDGNSVQAGSMSGSTVSVEVLEPEYEAEQLYMDADGDVFYRSYETDDPWRDFFGTRFSENYPTRPLRKMVPENG